MPMASSDFGQRLSVDTDKFWISRKDGIGGGRHAGIFQDMLCTWRLPWLAVEWPWSALARPLLTLLAQMGVETTPP